MENNKNQIADQEVVDNSQPENQLEHNQSEPPDTETIKNQKSRKPYFLYGVFAGLLSLIIIPIFLLLSIRTKTPQTENSNQTENKESAELGYNIYINEPDNNAHILQGDPILLKGEVVKITTNDEFWQYNMTWTSDTQGFLGRGEVLAYKYLNPGEHNITFTSESNKGVKSSTKINVVVKPDSSLNEPYLSQYLSECEKDNKYKDCLYEIIPKLAVWNKDASLKLINENEIDKTLKSVYDGIIYDYAKTTYNSDLCAELSKVELLEGCYVSVATGTKNPDLCELAGSRIGNCYHWVASATRDESYCPKADNPPSCIKNVKNNVGKDPYFNL